MFAARVGMVARPMDAAVRTFAAQAAKPSALQQLLFDAPSQNPLNEAFPGVPVVEAAKPAAPSAVKTTKLKNGVTVASRDAHGSTASVGVYVKAGSRYETVPGTAYALEQLAFKTTQQRSTIKLARDMENAGAVVSAKAGREVFAYTGEALRDSVATVAGALTEAVTQPKLWYWEVNETLHDVETVTEEKAANAASAVIEGVHAAAFGSGSSLGHGLTATTEGLHAISADTVRSFMASTFTAGNIVVSGTNIDHDDLVSIAEGSLGGIPSGAGAAASKATYTGGESLVRSGSGTAHVALALNAPGLASPAVHALGVLQSILGSTAPAGLKVGYSRASRLSAAAEKNGFIGSLSSFALPYSDAGLIGITGTASDADAGKLVAAIVGLLKDTAGSAISAEELARAKAWYKLNYALSVESRAGARDSIATSILLNGKVTSVADTLKAIDAVTVADVQAVAKAALASPVSISAVGSLTTVPRYDVLANMLNSIANTPRRTPKLRRRMSHEEEHPMTDEEAQVLAERDLHEGKAPSTAARHFVHAEMEKVKSGAMKVANRRQAVAIGLSKARKAGLPIGRKGSSSSSGASTSSDEQPSTARKDEDNKGVSKKKSKKPARGASKLAKEAKQESQAKSKASGAAAAQKSSLERLAKAPASKRSSHPRIFSTTPTRGNDEVAATGIRKKLSKPASRPFKGKIGAAEEGGQGLGVHGAPQASQLGGKVAGARIRAKARGEDPEAGVRRARREVEAEEEASMRKRARKA